jgi:hypothetical protein
MQYVFIKLIRDPLITGHWATLLPIMNTSAATDHSRLHGTTIPVSRGL